jgi:hypothetical protein
VIRQGSPRPSNLAQLRLSTPRTLQSTPAVFVSFSSFNFRNSRQRSYFSALLGSGFLNLWVRGESIRWQLGFEKLIEEGVLALPEISERWTFKHVPLVRVT